jgi:hypothetical protein
LYIFFRYWGGLCQSKVNVTIRPPHPVKDSGYFRRLDLTKLNWKKEIGKFTVHKTCYSLAWQINAVMWILQFNYTRPSQEIQSLNWHTFTCNKSIQFLLNGKFPHVMKSLNFNCCRSRNGIWWGRLLQKERPLQEKL